MTADEFVERYRRMAPSVEEMLEYGSCREIAEEVISGYIALPKSTSVAARHTDPLLDLIERFDTRTLYVCLLSFDPKGLDFYRDRIAPSGRIPIAIHEADPVVLCPDTGEIVQLDHDDFALNFQMGRWAASGGAFLDAAIKWAEYEAPFQRQHIDDPPLQRHEKETNNKAATAWAQECARIAGLAPSESGLYELGLWTY